MKHVIQKALDRDFIRVGKSRIQGRGVSAKRKIPKGTRIIEYVGERVPVSQFMVEVLGGKPASIYAFRLNESFVIDGARDGNDARFINHSCEPNCEVYVFDDRAYVYAMRDIKRGEELTFDYQLQSSTRRAISKTDSEKYRCNCGSEHCRGTMIAAKAKLQKNQILSHHSEEM
jgi:SET domain-containing protein